MSHADDVKDALEARFADATVSFEVGANQTNRHGQRRRIIFTRGSGVARHSSAPGRTVDTPGSPIGTHTREVFVREELFKVELRAEDDDALDIMFDRFLKCVFLEYGPNALLDENPYDWAGGDSTSGGANTTRIPAIHFGLWVRLRSLDAFPLPIIAAENNGVVNLLDSSQAVNPLAP